MHLERGKTLGKIACGDVNVSQGPTEIVKETGVMTMKANGWSVEKGVNNSYKVREAEINELKGISRIGVGQRDGREVISHIKVS